MAVNMKETELYTPIKIYLENLGYEVKGEVKDCDIVAKKEDFLIVIELKLTLNITLLLQAVDRFSLADIVYIAIPKQCSIYKKQSKSTKKLVKRLGLGLIVVDIQKTQQYVEVINDPQDYKPRINKRKQIGLLKEFNLRLGDPMQGGSRKTTAGLTAYRQRSIRIAEYLSHISSAKGTEINKAINEPQATTFLNKNYYQWFNNVARGIYNLSEKGQQELPLWLEKMQQIKVPTAVD